MSHLWLHTKNCAFVMSRCKEPCDCGGIGIEAAADAMLAYVKNHPEAMRDFRAQPMRLPAASEERKAIPLTTGLLDYFPDALAMVAYVSHLGNLKHNPGEPLHHARGKSMDHADCISRHLVDRDSDDVIELADGTQVSVPHAGFLAWRALALLQELLEQRKGLPLPRGAWPAEKQP